MSDQVWLILRDTMLEGVVIACHTEVDEQSYPTVFVTKGDADAEIADHIILQCQDVLKGYRTIEELDLDEWAEPFERDSAGYHGETLEFDLLGEFKPIPLDDRGTP